MLHVFFVFLVFLVLLAFGTLTAINDLYKELLSENRSLKLSSVRCLLFRSISAFGFYPTAAACTDQPGVLAEFPYKAAIFGTLAADFFVVCVSSIWGFQICHHCIFDAQ